MTNKIAKCFCTCTLNFKKNKKKEKPKFVFVHYSKDYQKKKKNMRIKGNWSIMARIVTTCFTHKNNKLPAAAENLHFYEQPKKKSQLC